MKIGGKISFLAALFLTACAATAQIPMDSLKPFVVSATMNPARQDIVPARVSVIPNSVISTTPVTNTDELLVSVPGLFANRSWGIFSKNGAVTMRGLSGSSRVLVLLDGIPLNRAGGGGINWHLIQPENISHVEVLSGPASSLYGQNAMGGVIQIFSRLPSDSLSIRTGVDYGSYNTLAGNISIGKSTPDKKFYWIANAFYRQGDGYILSPDDQRSQYDSEAYLREANFLLSGGVKLKPGHNLKVSGVFQADKRGTGLKVFEPQGGFNSYLTQLYSAQYNGILTRDLAMTSSFYFQDEQLTTLDEKVNNQGLYKLVDIKTMMHDIGILTHFVLQKKTHQFTFGGEFRTGKFTGEDFYRTSTDVLESGGVQNVAGLFLQDEITLFNNHLFIVAGIRFDAATFSKGYLNVMNPTKETGFTKDIHELFDNNRWSSFSPKLAVRYRFNNQAGIFISAGRGFSAPKLNDLTNSGKIRKGFKLANPALGPEIINNLELGGNLYPVRKLEITPSVYYSYAKSLQYQVSTGDSVDVSGVLSPVFQVRNVAGVKIRGAEVRLEYAITPSLFVYGSYSFTVSRLKTATSSDTTISKLDGKDLSEVPQHLASGGIQYRTKRWFIKSDWTYTDELWYDDENTILTDSYHIFNIKTGYHFTPLLSATFTIQDLFDNVHVDKKGLLSPGRFLLIGIRFQTRGK